MQSWNDNIVIDHCLLIIPHLWNSQNYFHLTGAESYCPCSPGQGFNGNIISITEKWQPAETDEERLGHPPNQCPWKLPRAVPTRACPGNVVHHGPRVPVCTRVCLCIHRLGQKQKPFWWNDNLVELEFREGHVVLLATECFIFTALF